MLRLAVDVASGDEALGGRRRDPVDGHPGARRLPPGGRRSARRRSIADQRGHRRWDPRRVARPPQGQSLLPGRNDVSQDVRDGTPAHLRGRQRVGGAAGRGAGLRASRDPRPVTRDPATGTTEPQGGNSGQPHDPLTFGTGVVASILARVLQEKGIEILVSHPVTELVTEEGGRVVGVRAQGPAGTVERRGAVVLATSTYDWDADLVEELVGLGRGRAPRCGRRGASPPLPAAVCRCRPRSESRSPASASSCRPCARPRCSLRPGRQGA